MESIRKRDFTEYKELLIESKVWQSVKSPAAFRMRSRAEEKTKNVKAFIDSIGEKYIQDIFILRCFDGLEWIAISNKVGAYGQEEAIRKIYSRYLKNIPAA